MPHSDLWYYATLVTDDRGWRIIIEANERTEDVIRGDRVPDNELLETASAALMRCNWVPARSDGDYRWHGLRRRHCDVRWVGP